MRTDHESDEQLRPSPRKPSGHTHMKLPGVLTQYASWAHILLFASSEHSFTSSHPSFVSTKPNQHVHVTLPSVFEQLAYS
eukprot:3933914-Rhodomonas_salina.2